MGKYILNNNEWGISGATGQQCTWGTCQSGDAAGWATNWNWTAGKNFVLTYSSIVWGWQYGFQVSNTGLPVAVSANKAINCTWDFTPGQLSGQYDIAYDIWLHPNGNPPSSGGQSDEIMIWLNWTSGAVPSGSTAASGFSLAGATWNLWEGNSGSWPIHSYVRVGNITSSVLNITTFLQDLVSRGLIPNTRFVTGVQAGIEVRSGSGTLTTTDFSCQIQ
ncbi:MAG: hypothetical protein JOZ69_03865 [Myxococcales bacterium]|nr:hypothetical protein [Myxococcales bacterium]